MKKNKPDKIILTIVISLVIYGLVIFSSASLGLLARGGARFSSIIANQILFGIFLGGLFAYIASKINYKIWGKYSFWLWVISIIATLAVFIPGLGFSHGGARRWIIIAGLSIQPAEFLKIAYIIYVAAWLSRIKEEVRTFKYGFLPFVIISGITIFPLLFQPDIGTTIVILISGTVLYFLSGSNLKHLLLVGLLGLILFGILIMVKPYIWSRLMTFFDHSIDSQGSSYQIQQSLIAVGSGQLTGRGFGQSLQKFHYLPEPIGDSVFAVASEEFGFIGMIILVLLFLSLAIRSLYLSSKIKDMFGSLILSGIAVSIVAQSFFNMGAMLGIFPLSGLPLIFVSHGGTAMFFSLLSIGIILNVTRKNN